jgi:hypothetical protein
MATPGAQRGALISTLTTAQLRHLLAKRDVLPALSAEKDELVQLALQHCGELISQAELAEISPGAKKAPAPVEKPLAPIEKAQPPSHTLPVELIGIGIGDWQARTPCQAHKGISLESLF